MKHNLLLTLVRAPDDAASFSPGYQRELRQFLSLARAEGGEIQGLSFSRTFTDVNDALCGEFIIPSTRAENYVLHAAVSAWMLGRSGRGLCMECDDVLVEGASLSELFCLLSLSIAMKPLGRSVQTASV